MERAKSGPSIRMLVSVIAGLPLLVLPGGSLESQSAGRAPSPEIVRIIGGPDADLTEVGTVLELGSGQILVSQPRDHQILLLSPGAPARRIGRQGEGPGEYRNLSGVGRTESGFWVADLPTRVTLLNGDGGFDRSIALNPAYTLAGDATRYRLTEVLGASGSGTVWASGQSGGRQDHREDGVLVISPESGSVRMPASVRSEHCFATASGGRRMPSPFCVNPIIRGSAGGTRLLLVHVPLPVSTTTEVRFQVIDPIGQAVLARALPLPSSSVTSHDIAWFADYYGSLPGTPQAVVQRFTSADHPGFHAPIRDAAIGEDGAIWARLHAPVGDSVVTWRRIFPVANPAPEASLPVDARVGEVSVNSMLVAQTDESGFPEILRLTWR